MLNAALTYRAATAADLAFVLDAVIEAERSGTGASSYERVLGYSTEEFRSFLKTLFLPGIPGTELCLEHYVLAEVNGQPVGTVAWWVEGHNGHASNHLKGQPMAEAVGMTRWMEIQAKLRKIELPSIPRTPGTLQIDELFVAKKMRGSGIAAQLIEIACQRGREAHPTVQTAQGMCVLENDKSRKAFTKAGFKQVRTESGQLEALAPFMPGTGRVLFERAL